MLDHIGLGVGDHDVSDHGVSDHGVSDHGVGVHDVSDHDHDHIGAVGHLPA